MRAGRTLAVKHLLAPIDRHDWLACAALTLVVGVLFLQAPTGGDFYWSDAPRHALNGAFVKDFVGAFPIHDPVEFAERYYVQYPALTVLFYPPLFYFLLAPAYAVFGVSHETALAVVLLHYIAFAIGSYYLFRNWLTPGVAVAGAAALAASPEIAFWGRQVMLEVPAFAFAIWSAVYFVGYLRERAIWLLYAAAALLTLAIYTKVSVAFLAPVYAIVLIYLRGTALFRDRHTYLTGTLALVSLLPLTIITLEFGQANVQSAVGIADAQVSRLSIAGWTWYAAQLPNQLGPVTALAVVLGAAALVYWRKRISVVPSELLFLGLWFVVGYGFFSSIDLKEARHSVFILPPLIAVALLPLSLFAPWRVGLGAALAIAVATIGGTMLYYPVLRVGGFAEAAARIAKLAPADGVVLFSGYRDGSFVFNMRTHEERRDISVVRADKLFLSVAVRRELGVREQLMSESEIETLLNRLHISYVVAQPDFWTDLEAMRRFYGVLNSHAFVPIARIPTRANYAAAEQELVIYRNTTPLAPGPVNLQLELPMIDRTLSGSVGGVAGEKDKR